LLILFHCVVRFVLSCCVVGVVSSDCWCYPIILLGCCFIITPSCWWWLVFLCVVGLLLCHIVKCCFFVLLGYYSFTLLAIALCY
jgi:hypothetical protein